MPRSRTRLRLPAILSVLSTIFLVLSIVSGIASITALHQLGGNNYDRSGLAAVQLRIHFSLLLSELHIIDLEQEKASPDEALLQYDIVYQRLMNLPHRPPYNTALSAQDLKQIDGIFTAIKAETERFDQAADTDSAAPLVGVRARLLPKRDDVNLVAGRIIQLMSDFRRDRREEIARSTHFLIFSTAGLVLTGAAFAFLLWRSRTRLRKQNAALEDLTEQLMSANKAKTDFLASMSHELRTPLNAIIGFAEMINHEVFGKIGDTRYADYAADIRISGAHLLNLINDILDLSKIEAGEFTINPATFALRDAVEEAARIVEMNNPDEADRIAIAIVDGTDDLYADQRTFRQIVINLLSNAIKYSAQGAPVRVDAEPEADGGIHIRVTDKGIGIPKEDLELVLEPFGQSRQNSALTHEGTGLGLALSKQLMELNGGSIRLESEVGTGTTVHLHFPNRPVAPVVRDGEQVLSSDPPHAAP